MPVLIPEDIDPEDIKVGDLVRCRLTYRNGDAEIYEFKVTSVDAYWIYSKHAILRKEPEFEDYWSTKWEILK